MVRSASKPTASRSTPAAPPARGPLDPVDAALTFAVLDSHDVRYVVIGGFAVQIHGVEGFAPTADADITPATDDANLDRLAAALRELEAQVSYRGRPVDVVVPIDRHLFKDKISVTFLTRHGPVDVVLRPDGTAGYDDLAAHAVSRPFGDRQVTVAAVEDIVRSKQAAGRPKDQKAMRPLMEWLRRQS